MEFQLRMIVFTSADIRTRPLKGWLWRQMCVASLTREAQLGGAVSPHAETAGIHQETDEVINMISMFLGNKRFISEFLGFGYINSSQDPK